MSCERGWDPGKVARSLSSDVTLGQAVAMKANPLFFTLLGVCLQTACVADPGGPNLDASFDAGDALDLTLLPNCKTKRIKLVYTSPETLALGETTLLHAELLPDWWRPPMVNDASVTDAASITDASAHDAAPVAGDATTSSAFALGLTTPIDSGSPDALPLPVPFRLTWMLGNDEAHTATGMLVEDLPCKPGSISCVKFTCKGTGATALDAGTETPVSGVWIVAKYEDETCFDTARVALRCSFALKP
jgi:hypothetical protein